MVFSIEQLNFFVASARCGSFSEAGRQTNRSQSAVSTAVANLEDALGVELFDRGAKYLALTAEGEILLRDAESILYRCGNFQNRAMAFSCDVDGRLRIAVDECLQEPFLFDKIRPFENKFPFTELEILVGVYNDVRERVLAGDADIGILVGTGIPETVENYRLLSYLPFRGVVSTSHPLASREKVTVADLEGHRQVVVTARGAERNTEMTVFSSRTWILESYFTALCIVKRGLGWGFLPEHLVEGAVRNGQLACLPLLLEKRCHTSPVYLLWNKSSSFGKAGRWFFDRLVGE